MRKTAILLALAALGATAAPATALAPGSTVLVDRPTGFGELPFDGQNDASLGDHSMSADGCFVVYASRSDDLVGSDEDSAENVYRQNRCAPGTPPVQVNRTAAGEPGRPTSRSYGPTISADGRYVAFHTTAYNLHPYAGDFRPQVLVKDMQTGALILASRETGPNGAPLQSGADGAVISGNGEAVVFRATGLLDASNVDGAADETDVYVRFLASSETRMVSVATAGARGGGASFVDIDHSGRNVAFTTLNRLDAAADTDTAIDAYVRRAIGQTDEATRLVSLAGGGQPAGADSAIDVAVAGGLVAYTNGTGAFLSDCSAACGTAARLDQPLQGGSNAASDFQPYFPPGGGVPTHVFWTTRAPLAADPDASADLYRAPVGGGPVSLMTAGVSQGDVFAGSSSTGGSVIVFDSLASDLAGTGGRVQGVFARVGTVTRSLMALAGITPRAPLAGDAELPRLHAASEDGRFVVFTSNAVGLGAPLGTEGRPVGQVYVRDVVTGQTKLVSVGSSGAPQNAESDFRSPPSIDAAGRRVVFPSKATNLVPGVTDGLEHVYLRDLATGVTALVDRTADGSAAASGAERPQISGDGTKVAFLSGSPDLPGGQAGTRHAYVADLTTGRIALVDRATGGAVANASASEVELSYTGTRVAFTSRASNLGGPANSLGDVYVVDRAAGTTTWASKPAGTAPAQRFAGQPSLSHDGTRIVFTEGELNNGTAVFLRDLGAASPVLVSEPNDRSGRDPVLSGDGKRVALFIDGSPVLRELATGALQRLDLRNGSSEPGRLYGHAVSLSGNGACAVLASRSDDLVSPSYGPDYGHIFVRSLGAACAPAPAGGGGTSVGGAADSTAPLVSRARALPNRFAVAARRTARSAAVRAGGLARGTRFAFKLSEAASTRIRIKGRRRGRALVLTRARTRAGANRIRFSGRVGRRILRPGVYRATITATDAAGNRSKPARVRFRVVRG